MKDILLVSIPVSIPAILTFITNMRVKRMSEVKEDIKSDIERNRLEDIARHDETIRKLADLEHIVDHNDIDVVRSRIVAFENLCRIDKDYTSIKEHQYKTIFKDIDKWAYYHKKYPDLNGEIDIAIESIREHYREYQKRVI